jgi:hypothetical protein
MRVVIGKMFSYHSLLRLESYDMAPEFKNTVLVKNVKT